ncbi:aldo/keto reductase [Candidatus Nomurabacteria bacterium]|nr:aldo/keto reductase [Candidatus Nomurabacteria bacterium]
MQTQFQNHTISQIIKGGWQLAGGHGNINAQQAISDMFSFVDAGINTFDCADIYTGVEEMIGHFRMQYQKKHGLSELEKIHIHTKFVPDYESLHEISLSSVENIIDRSLRRLQTERLDLVQFHFWDFSINTYTQAALHLKTLQQKGKIKHIGLTNFDVVHMKELLDLGVEIASNQIQYSLIDNRSEKGMLEFCKQNDIAIFCYGTVSGGLLSNRYLHAPEPHAPFENRSLTKYKLIQEERGNWTVFQTLLQVLHEIGQKHHASITNIATRYILDHSSAKAVIIGARDATHLQDNIKLFDFSLDTSDREKIQKVLESFTPLPGDIYELERDKHGKHGSIMKYNLNKKI